MITLQEILERDKRSPSVTVSMTCYNHAKYIDEAMRGVLMQKTNFPVNIVIHDDASPDGSGEIIRRYASEHPNITAIIEETNLVQNGKPLLPVYLPHYTGKYIAYCECDDFWIDENKLQIQVDYLEANPDCIAVYSNTLPVNKYSEYDESTRNHYMTLPEGDYPRDKLFWVDHQLASLVTRNLWRLMSDEDISYYLKVRANGDEKILALLLRIGRVHYFSEEFAAHRRVVDEGDSYSARMARKSDWERYCFGIRQSSELYLMTEHFSGKEYMRKYLTVLWGELRSRVKFHKSVIKDANLNECYHLRNIPLYVWPMFALYVLYRVAKKIAKIILPRKVLTFMKKFRYNQLSALSSQLSALSSGYDYALASHDYSSIRKISSLSLLEAAGNFRVDESLWEAAA